ncbi:MAG: lactoylglutathione lyase, partial [Burkholderiales bacterium PBB5]
MTTATLEHANITLLQIEPVLQLLLTALPGWRVRGQGTMDWFGKPIRWLHVGTDSQYLALQDGGEGRGPAWQSHQVGVKHLGLVVDDLDALVARLQAAGIAMDHPGGSHPHRRSAYYHLGDLVQLEFMQYLSIDPAQRNDYRFQPVAA